MVKETRRKIDFTPYLPVKGKVKDTSKPPYATVNVKYGVLSFNKKAVETLQMSNKFIQFFYQPRRKIIGWKIKDKIDEGHLNSKMWRLAKANKAGVIVFSISKLLDNFSGLDPIAYKCEVMRYREQADIMTRGDVYYYLQVDRPYNEVDEDEENEDEDDNEDEYE